MKLKSCSTSIKFNKRLDGSINYSKSERIIDVSITVPVIKMTDLLTKIILFIAKIIHVIKSWFSF